MNDREKQPNTSEKESPIDSKTAFYLLGIVSKLILRVHENPENVENLTYLRIFLSQMTLPKEVSLEEYLTAQGLTDQLPIVAAHSNNISSFLAGMATAFKVNPKINWVEYEDQVLRESMLTPNVPLDSEIDCMVTYRFGTYNVLWTIPKPEVYWQCQEIDKLIHMVLAVLEEIFHITQNNQNIIKFHTIGGEIDMTNNQDEVFSSMVTRLCETDVTNILSTAIPEMIEQNWSWYSARVNQKPSEKHHPMDADISFMFGIVVAQLTDQSAQYMANMVLKLPEYLAINPEARNQYFSNHFVLGHLKGYLKNILEDDVLGKISLDDWEVLISHELSNDGLTKMFLIHCVDLMREHGKDWLEVLNRGRWEEDNHDTHFGSESLEILLAFLSNNPKWFKVLTENKSRFNFFEKNPQTIDEFVTLLIPPQKRKFFNFRSSS